MSVKMLVKTSNPFVTNSGIDDTLHAVYMDCFDAIRPDTDAYLAMYMWRDVNWPATLHHCNPRQLTNKLISKIGSKNSGSKIEILFDVDFMEDVQERNALWERFTEAGGRAYYPKFKEPGLGLDGKPKLHNKTMLFSRLTFSENPIVLKELAGKTIENVVLQSSCNIWPTQYSQANQVIIYYDNAALYDYSQEEWETIKTDLGKTGLSAFKKFQPDDQLTDRVKTYAFPRNSHNLMESVIENIEKFKDGTSPRIRIAMGGFSNSKKSKAIARQLVQLAKTGREVKLVLRKGEKDGLGDETKVILQNSKIDFIELEKQISGKTCKIHSKFLLLDGQYKLNNEIEKHKIAWAGSLNFTHSALTTNSETLLRMTDDLVYKDLYKAWCQLRYTSAIPRIGACLGYGHNQKVYFFHGKQYVRWKPAFGIETIRTNQACRRLGTDGWKDLPNSFSSDIDAAFWCSGNGHAYFFKGSKYIKWKPGKGLVGSIRTTGKTGWTQLPHSFRYNIDAVLEHPENKHIYFFKGDEYCKWKLGEGIVDPAPRKIGVHGWQIPSWFRQGLDAALAHPEGTYIYFFRGVYYCKWKPGEGIISPIIRQVGQQGWEGLFFLEPQID